MQPRSSPSRVTGARYLQSPGYIFMGPCRSCVIQQRFGRRSARGVLGAAKTTRFQSTRESAPRERERGDREAYEIWPGDEAEAIFPFVKCFATTLQCQFDCVGNMKFAVIHVLQAKDEDER